MRIHAWLMLWAATAAVHAEAQTRLLRFPALHGERVVFCYGGDLWSAPSVGGTAVRLTAHEGLELFPRFSPDGRWIAFTGQLDGDEQVYVMPASGGSPKQLTHYPARGPLPPRWGYDNQVYGWTPDGQRVLFRSMRDGFDLTDTRLYTVSVEGGLPTPLPMPVSGGGALSPDGKYVAYSPLTRDFRTWKRYQGGWAQDLYLFDLEKGTAENFTHHVRTDRDPMWIGSEVWFASDRTGTLNLFRYDPATKALEQGTQSTQWDVRWPSGSADGRIVYELGGELAIFDPRTKVSTPIQIHVPTDDLARRPSRISVGNQVRDYGLSPKGERALFSARGDIFTAPIEHGPTRNLTNSSSAHDKHPAWSPDGRRIAFVSDASGEEQIWLVPQDGSAPATQLTRDFAVMLYQPEWSSDGKALAISDKDGKLHVVDVASGSATLVADEERGQLRDHAWSPCGMWLAFSLSDANGYRSLWLWSREKASLHRVTDELLHEFSPAWDPKGERLFFLADRSFAPRIGNVEWNYQMDRQTGIFALALRKDLPPLFPARSDEVKLEDEPKVESDQSAEAAPVEAPQAEGEKVDEKVDEKADAKTADEKKAATVKPGVAIAIDLEGLAERVERVDVPFENYRGLSAANGFLLCARTGAFYYGRESDRTTELRVYDLAARKEHTFSGEIAGWALSEDGKVLLLREGKIFTRTEVGAPGKEKKTVSTTGLAMDRVPAQEWAQIYDEVWRRYRDFFYVANMHGYDWKALGDQYRPLVAQVAHRSDLNYVIGELIAELNVGHAYIAGGDYEQPERVAVALPGARFELDAASGRYRIARIFRGQNDQPELRSPLTEVGVDAKEGDYVLAIDGVELMAGDDPYRLLRGKAGGMVRLTLNAAPTREGAREVAFRPLTSETGLIYHAWVEKNRRWVEEQSGGRFGYLHVPDMGEEGIAAFTRMFYGQIRKEGLVIDVRNNGGGNVSQMLIERLRRELLMGEFGRTSGFDTYPNTCFHGSLVCLLNENSASDGDIFPAMFRAARLGPLIGKRSWGGIIGITDRGPLQDGGTVNVPEFGNTGGVDQGWIIEGHGVDPDIVVENEPSSVIAGRDPQLEKALQVLTQRVQENPKKLPQRPADPIRR
jgi:tricorn protease